MYNTHIQFSIYIYIYIYISLVWFGLVLISAGFFICITSQVSLTSIYKCVSTSDINKVDKQLNVVYGVC